MFVSNERRTGPFDRRGADMRHRERQMELRKIKQLRRYKERDRATPSAEPLLNKKRLTLLGLALVLIVIMALMAA
jgi:hypothetical protein